MIDLDLVVGYIVGLDRTEEVVDFVKWDRMRLIVGVVVGYCSQVQVQVGRIVASDLHFGIGTGLESDLDFEIDPGGLGGRGISN